MKRIKLLLLAIAWLFTACSGGSADGNQPLNKPPVLHNTPPDTTSLPPTTTTLLTGASASSQPLTPVQQTASDPVRNALTPTATILPATVTAAQPQSPTPSPSPPSPGRTRYRLSAVLDYPQQHLKVDQEIIYANQSGQTLSELLFVVEPNRWEDVFRLEKITLADGSAPNDVILDGERLWLLLPVPLGPGDMTGLSFSYSIHIPRYPGPLSYTGRQTNLGDWYLFLPPYIPGQGWLIHDPAAAGEHLVYEVADFLVDIQVLDPPDGLQAAASALVEREGNRYRYRLDAARSFAWSASPEYQVLAGSTSGGVQVTGYVFPEHSGAGSAALATTLQAVELYSELFGPYPRTSLAFVEADFFDGMEYDGLYFLGREYYAEYSGSLKSYLVALSAHETAHQWWYAAVGNDPALEPWLDEALCVYSEALYYERYAPDLISWWWNFRVNRFSPDGSVGSTIYDHDNFRSYVNAVYLRGALFFEDLRRYAGDQRFLTILSEHFSENLHQLATTDQFFARLEQSLPGEIDFLLQRYFNYP